MHNNNFRPSILMGSKNPMKTNNNSQITLQNDNKNIKNNLKQIHNRLFILSPTVNDGKDIECSSNDFIQEKTDYINLGYIGKAIKTMHRKTNRLYSIKAMHKDKIVKNGLTNLINKVMEIMYKIDNYYFLKLLNHFEDDNNLYFIFECINETTLLDKINLRALTKEKIYKYFKQILEAVQFLHSKHIFFFSLEPESIIIDSNDNVRLTDYAYNKISRMDLNKRGGIKTDTNIYINSYTAPELISFNKGIFHKHNSKGSEKTDLWQLGILSYEMITGNLLFNIPDGNLEEFYKTITTPVIKNNEIIKKISEIPDDYKIFRDVIMQLLDINPKERLSIDKILKIKEIQNIKYEKEEFEYKERIINLKSANEDKSPQEQLIDKLKKENQKLKNEINELKLRINELKLRINELTTKNEDLNKQNMNYNKIINEEPNESNIGKELVELKSQIRTLEVNKELAESSLAHEKSLNESLNNQIGELKIELDQKNFKSNETIKVLEKKIEDLENKLFNPNNSNGYSNESLQYYLSLFNDNINQFTSIINQQFKLNADLAENNKNKIENFMNEKEKSFSILLNELFLKLLQNKNDNNNSNNNDLNEKNYKDKIVWLEKQINELIIFKQDCCNLEIQVNRLQNENEILKSKMENIQKLQTQKEEVNKLKLQKIRVKIKETFDKFIMQNCPNKNEEFKIICQNFSFDN